MLDALLAGQRDSDALAQLAKANLRTMIPALVEAFEGTRFSARSTRYYTDLHLELPKRPRIVHSGFRTGDPAILLRLNG